jgi:DNA-binding beta-propeller fold protein YncE
VTNAPPRSIAKEAHAVTRLVVTSASGPNGEGYGAVLRFTADGELIGVFCDDDRVSDPRGLSLHPTKALVYLNSDDRILALDEDGRVCLDSGRIDGLDPGGGIFGPDGRYYVTMRRRGTILAIPASLDHAGTPLLPGGSVPFPRGFGFGVAGEVYLSSGIGPSGEGDNTIAVFSPEGTRIASDLVDDPELSPLDLAVAPNGNVVVSSEWPFGARDAITTVREYLPLSGELVRVLSAPPSVGFARPRGLRFAGDDRLYCVGQHHVVVFQFSTGAFLAVVAQLTDLNGQAIVVIP